FLEECRDRRSGQALGKKAGGKYGLNLSNDLLQVVVLLLIRVVARRIRRHANALGLDERSPPLLSELSQVRGFLDVRQGADRADQWRVVISQGRDLNSQLQIRRAVGKRRVRCDSLPED